MTAEQLIAISGAVLAVLFAYVPGLASWYNPIKPELKRLIMLGIMVVVAGAVYGLSCSGYWVTVTCDEKGLTGLVVALITAIVANQGTFAILPKVGYNKTL